MKFDNEEVLKRAEKALARIIAVAAKKHLTP